MIDYKARPNFQGETWNHVKFTWFHVALQTKTWTRFLVSLAKVHGLLWRTQTAFHTERPVFTLTGAKFHTIQRPFSILGGKWQKKRSHFALDFALYWRTLHWINNARQIFSKKSKCPGKYEWKRMSTYRIAYPSSDS